MKIWNKVIDGLSFWWPMFGIIGIFAFVLHTAIQSDLRARSEHEKALAYCYAQGLVVAETEVGNICVDPKTMVKVK